MVKIIETRGGHRETCIHWGESHDVLTLGQVDIDGDYILAILLDEDGDVLEWISASTHWETAQNFATDAHTILLLDGDTSRNAEVIRREVELYNDCFGYAAA